MTSRDPTQRYREVQVQTAAKDELLILLLDGGVRFAESALLEMEKGDEEDRTHRHECLLKAQSIVLELMTSLSPDIGPELFRNLQELYRFTFSRLFEGNSRSRQDQVAEALILLKRIRGMWAEAVEKARAEREVLPDKSQPNSSLSVTG